MSQGLYVIGGGKVGTALAQLLGERGFPLTGIWNRSARMPTRGVLEGVVVEHGAFGPGLVAADLVLIAVSDDALPEVADKVRAHGVKRGAVVAHTSGALASSALGDIPGAELGSLHLLVACTDVQQAVRDLPGAVVTIEGSPAARELLQKAASALGSRAVELKAETKARYHGALVLASNLVVALVQQALGEAHAAGFNDDEALLSLTAGAVRLIRERGAAGALTGPVRRGDVETVHRHLQSLGKRVLPIYKELSRVALDLAADLPEDKKKRLAELLEEPS